jgi:signal transduction histidine kinase
MSRLTAAARGPRGLGILVLSTAALWTLGVGASLLWGAAAVRRTMLDRGTPAPEAAVGRYDQLVTAGHLAVWLTGLAFVAVGGCWLLRLDREREAAERRLLGERETLRLLVRDLQRTEAELGRYAACLAEANRLKDLFTDVLSHDLLNPATASRYLVERLRRGEADPQRLRLLDAVEHNLVRLSEMVRDAAQYSRLEETPEGAALAVDLGWVVREVLAELEPEFAAAGISVEPPAPGSHPAAVHPMFANVVANLVGNAVKYAAAGKRIALAIESLGPEEWLLSVRDWGPGIPDGGKESLFTRFERLGKQGVRGTGLGLAIARRIVELQAGRIWVEDNPEGGSVFQVRVRKAADEGRLAAARPRDQGSPATAGYSFAGTAG